MARKLRIEYAAAVYHVMSRGDRRKVIFEDDRDRERFLETVAEACQKTSWQAHAYCQGAGIDNNAPSRKLPGLLSRRFPNPHAVANRRRSDWQRFADLKIGDTAGLETCGTVV